MKISFCSFLLTALRPLTVMITLSLPLHSEAGNNYYGNRLDSKDSILIKMNTVTKSDTISIFTDVSQEILFFSASGTRGKLFQLFIFDMDGTLVKQAQVLSRKTTLLTGLENGNYLLEVFSNDERIGSGSLTKK